MSERSTTWAFIIYPDSAPKEWRKLLKLSYIACAVSPLHSPDHDGSEEELKQHWHILLNYDSLKSIEQVKQLSTTLNGTKPIIIQNPSGYYKYLVHTFNPEKEQFPLGFNAIEKYNGFDPDKFESFTKKQIRAFKKEIIKIITSQNITEYETLIDYFINNSETDNYDIYFDIVTTNTIFFNSYLCSKRNRIKKYNLDDVNQRISKLEVKVSKWIQNLSKLKNL